MSKKKHLIAALILIAALLTVGLVSPNILEEGISRSSGHVELVKANQIIQEGRLTPLELIRLFSGEFLVNPSLMDIEPGMSTLSYPVAEGNHHSRDTALDTAVEQIMEFLTNAGMEKTYSLVSAGRKRLTDVSVTCQYIVVPTYPEPKTAMIWLCEFYFPGMRESISIVMDDATDTIVTLRIPLEESLEPERDYMAASDQLVRAFCLPMGASFRYDGSEPGPEEETDIAYMSGGELYYTYELFTDQNEQAHCTVCWTVNHDGTLQVSIVS